MGFRNAMDAEMGISEKYYSQVGNEQIFGGTLVEQQARQESKKWKSRATAVACIFLFYVALVHFCGYMEKGYMEKGHARTHFEPILFTDKALNLNTASNTTLQCGYGDGYEKLDEIFGIKLIDGLSHKELYGVCPRGSRCLPDSTDSAISVKCTDASDVQISVTTSVTVSSYTSVTFKLACGDLGDGQEQLDVIMGNLLFETPDDGFLTAQTNAGFCPRGTRCVDDEDPSGGGAQCVDASLVDCD